MNSNSNTNPNPKKKKTKPTTAESYRNRLKPERVFELNKWKKTTSGPMHPSNIRYIKNTSQKKVITTQQTPQQTPLPLPSSKLRRGKQTTRPTDLPPPIPEQQELEQQQDPEQQEPEQQNNNELYNGGFYNTILKNKKSKKNIKSRKVMRRGVYKSKKSFTKT